MLHKFIPNESIVLTRRNKKKILQDKKGFCSYNFQMKHIDLGGVSLNE